MNGTFDDDEIPTNRINFEDPSDVFLYAINNFSKTHASRIRIASLSCLCRLNRYPLPPVEYVVMPGIDLIDEFEKECSRSLKYQSGNHECRLMEYYGHSIYVYTPKQFSASILTHIEGIQIDVQSRACIETSSTTKRCFHDKVILPKSDNFESFWHSFVINSQLPDYKIKFGQSSKETIQYLMGSTDKDPIHFRFRPLIQCKTSDVSANAGKRIITMSLLLASQNACFPLYFNQTYYYELLGGDHYDGFVFNAETFSNMYTNSRANMEGQKNINRQIINLCVLFSPIFEYSKQFPERAQQYYFDDSKNHSDTHDMDRLQALFKVSLVHPYTRNFSFMIYYLTCIFFFPLDITFDIICTLEAFFTIPEDDIDTWKSNNQKYWKEAICLLDIKKCNNLRQILGE